MRKDVKLTHHHVSPRTCCSLLQFFHPQLSSGVITCLFKLVPPSPSMQHQGQAIHHLITTSCCNHSTIKSYQSIHQTIGSRGSALTIVPFNQGSKQDVKALMDYIYATLGMDLDYILAFTAIPENGCEIDGLDNKSELDHCIMLVNLPCILGAVKVKKASHHFITHPTQVILPLFPTTLCLVMMGYTQSQKSP